MSNNPPLSDRALEALPAEQVKALLETSDFVDLAIHSMRDGLSLPAEAARDPATIAYEIDTVVDCFLMMMEAGPHAMKKRVFAHFADWVQIEVDEAVENAVEAALEEYIPEPPCNEGGPFD